MTPEEAAQYHRRENPQRKELEADIDAYLAAGGEIQQIPTGVGAEIGGWMKGAVTGVQVTRTRTAGALGNRQSTARARRSHG